LIILSRFCINGAMPPETNKKDELLHSFTMYPTIKFETQSPNEQVILLLRAHPITQLSWILATIFIILLSYIFDFFLMNLLTPKEIIFINILWDTGAFSYAFLNFISWLYNVGIVTNLRIVDVDFHSLLYKEVSATVITKIEDVTVKSGGFARSIFDYGNLFIQTAGTESNIEFPNIPHPTEASSIINNLMQAKDEP
jgi:hypothetical protein